MGQNSSKKLLFEAMHKVTGMPLREDIYSDNQVTQSFDNDELNGHNPKEAQEIQNKLNDVDVSSSALLGVIDKLTDLSPEEKNELSGLLNRVLKITGNQIPKFYNDTDAIGEDVGELNNNQENMVTHTQKIKGDSLTKTTALWNNISEAIEESYFDTTNFPKYNKFMSELGEKYGFDGSGYIDSSAIEHLSEEQLTILFNELMDFHKTNFSNKYKFF